MTFCNRDLPVQAAWLQFAISFVLPIQPKLPARPFIQNRILLLFPTPHVTEHSVQGPHSCQAMKLIEV